MILNTGQRTDIPAFFPQWLANRIKEGFVLVRNPYNPGLVTRYEINPEVVDAIGFCTKNPAPSIISPMNSSRVCFFPLMWVKISFSSK